MKQITHAEWEAQFDSRLKRPVEVDPAEMDEDELQGYAFFDNGSVRNAEGDYIIKCDQIR